MQIIYWAHSYRDDDALINRHFGILIEEAERMIVNFDPPSKSVNESKLDQNLRACDGMVAVLSWRDSGPSKYILHEIGLSLRARKPLLVFVDDRLPGDIIPARILQQRFSHRTFFRQFREHTHALRSLKSYMGEPPPTRYQPNFGQRACGLIGTRALEPHTRNTIHDFMEKRGYRPVALERVDTANSPAFEKFEPLANLDAVISCADSQSPHSAYWWGAVNAAAIPSVMLTFNPNYRFSEAFPREFQPRLITAGSRPSLEEALSQEFDLFEQDFLKATDATTIERYTRMQIEAGLSGHYQSETRREFMEVIMGDKYNISGQVGAVGPAAHAHDMTFNQTWNRMEKNINLAKLAHELHQLRSAMERSATEPEQKFAAGAVAAAEQSARQENGPKVIEYLKTAGTWALEVAQEIGVDVAKEAVKGAIGL